jgi:4-methyl-5(b-hydroxyethyl)-thiazole monophosphate biosynthesis
MKKVYVYMAEGFEEIEALAPVDILRRAGVNVTLVGVGDLIRTGARGVKVCCDLTASETEIQDADMIILPGGFPGFENLANDGKVIADIEAMLEKGGYVAAICGAPAAILGKKGYLAGKKATCYPGMENDLGCEVSDENVCVCGNIITSKSAATAMEFAFALCEILMGAEVTNKVKKSIVYND